MQVPQEVSFCPNFLIIYGIIGQKLGFFFTSLQVTWSPEVHTLNMKSCKVDNCINNSKQVNKQVFTKKSYCFLNKPVEKMLLEGK